MVMVMVMELFNVRVEFSLHDSVGRGALFTESGNRLSNLRGLYAYGSRVLMACTVHHYSMHLLL